MAECFRPSISFRKKEPDMAKNRGEAVTLDVRSAASGSRSERLCDDLCQTLSTISGQAGYE